MLTALNEKVRSIDRHMQALEQREKPLPVAVGALRSDIDGMIGALNSMKAEIDKILPSPIRYAKSAAATENRVARTSTPINNSISEPLHHLSKM